MSLLATATLACSTAPGTGEFGFDAGHDAGPVCKLAPIGDLAKPAELEVIVLRPDGTSIGVADGATVPIVTPPQGGRVVFVGVRARNVEACAANLTGALRDPTTQQVRLDKRVTNLVALGAGWGGSSDANAASFANVPVCPNQWASTDVYGVPFRLEVTLEDRGGRTVSRALDVVPVCAEPEFAASCACICKKGYVLGEACEAESDASSRGGALAPDVAEATP